MILCNLYGAPGAGKSTVRADVFRRLKQRGVNCEEVTEFAKRCVWEGRIKTLQCQPYIFATQLNDIEMLAEEVDVVITDSPLLLCYYYASKCEKLPPVSFFHYMRDAASMFNNMNYFLNRAAPYDERGRMQNEAASDAVGEEMIELFENLQIPLVFVDGDEESGAKIADDILAMLSEHQN